MLVVYSAHGSPGASTTAVYLAAQWAASGNEVLLVEADPGGGSLSHNLGIQFTPGLASFVAAGLDISGGNLIDHSQDVLFNNLHVMPSTSSPTGARQIVKWLEGPGRRVPRRRRGRHGGHHRRRARQRRLGLRRSHDAGGRGAGRGAGRQLGHEPGSTSGTCSRSRRAAPTWSGAW